MKKAIRFVWGFLLALLTLDAYADIQRWVDERGVVHYGDKIPPEYSGRGSIQLNGQGVRVKEKNRALTDTEQHEQSQLANQQKEASRAKEEQLRRDRSLMDTYYNIEEIYRARDRTLESIDNAISVTEVRLNEIAKQKIALDEALQKNVAQPQFIKMSAERDSLATEVKHLNEILIKRKAEREQTDLRYKAEIQRYKEISDAKLHKPSSNIPNAAPVTKPLPMLPARGKESN
ncbi:MAG: DUF4124 domain-containing protein [Pseudomonadota bacterium]